MLVASICSTAALPAATTRAEGDGRWRWFSVALSSGDQSPSTALRAVPLPRPCGGGKPAALPEVRPSIVDPDEIEAVRRGHRSAAAAIRGLERRFEVARAPAAG